MKESRHAAKQQQTALWLRGASGSGCRRRQPVEPRSAGAESAASARRALSAANWSSADTPLRSAAYHIVPLSLRSSRVHHGTRDSSSISSSSVDRSFTGMAGTKLWSSGWKQAGPSPPMTMPIGETAPANRWRDTKAIQEGKAARSGLRRSSWPTVPDRTTTASRLNFSDNSRCHCSHKPGGQRTHRRRISPRSINSRAISRASMVLPTPTSSAIRRRTASSRSAISSGTNW